MNSPTISEHALPERDLALEILRKMYLIRFFEQAAGQLYQQGKVKGGVHPYIGQEAIATGVCAGLRPEDLITSTHRGHGHHIAKGADLGRLMAEILGKASGYCAGRGGSMHVAAFEVGSLGAFPILASGAPVAVGAALSARLHQRDLVVVAFFGEGALGQGTLHEAINMAAIWKLPVIFVCENNQYAVSTDCRDSLAIQEPVRLAEAYGIAGEDLDGQDLLAVMATSSRAITRARSGAGPYLLHARSVRFEGHYFGEPQSYRTREEVQIARQSRDPITLFQSRLSEGGGFLEAEFQAVAEDARAAVEAALAFAEQSPQPDPEEVARYVYA
jgi:pyruvate dehydrogenase E1 component alpha subunit